MGYNPPPPPGSRRPKAPPPPPRSRGGYEPRPSGIANPTPPPGASGAFPHDECDYCGKSRRSPSGRTCANCGAARPELPTRQPKVVHETSALTFVFDEAASITDDVWRALGRLVPGTSSAGPR